MNAVTEISRVRSLGVDWDAIFADVNAWRGACLHHFSTVEMAVTESLLKLNESPSRGGTVRLRQLIGQRFEDLATAIGPEGAFSDVSQAVYLGLSHYRERHEAFRALLCHGAVKVTVDQSGQWTLVIRSLSIRSHQAERSVIVIEQVEAQTRLAALKRDGQQLVSMLGQLRKSVLG